MIFSGPRWSLVRGDCRDVLAKFQENRFDSAVKDPPYELGFMGKGWDRSGVAFQVETWRAHLRVLKPGAHLAAFGGSRTFHRVACAIEDAGFEIRDDISRFYSTEGAFLELWASLEREQQKLLLAAFPADMVLSWLYGSGNPKTLEVSKALELGGRPKDIRRAQMGAGYQPSGRGRKNYDHGSGSVRNGAPVQWQPTTEEGRRWADWHTGIKPGWEPIILARKPLDGTIAENIRRWGTGGLNVGGCRLPRPERTKGTWPPNVILDEHAAQLLDARAGPRKSGAMRAGTYAGRKSNTYQPDAGRPLTEDIPASAGGASRFFYCPKASKAERELGCEHLPERSGGETTDREDGSAGLSSPRAGAGRGGGRRNIHPTVKPQELMRWLVRLVTPLNGLVLDGFTGSGSTGVAALAEGFGFFGVEQSAEYVEIARARLEHAARRKS